MRDGSSVNGLEPVGDQGCAAGCHHGRLRYCPVRVAGQDAGQTIERPWAHSFIGGLVPPSVTETASQCPNGVARVSTQLSFLNMVAHLVTFSIYSPMTINVQCAGGDDENDAAGSDLAVVRTGSAAAAMQDAVDLAARTGQPVQVDLN
jgi:hypothetical protein